MIKTKAKPQILVLHSKWNKKKLKFINEFHSYNKPKCALWTCRWKKNYLDTRWIRYLNYQEEQNYVVGNDLGDYVYKLIPKKDKKLRILKLETFDDYEKVAKFDDDFWDEMIDYATVSKEYDGIQFGSRLIKDSINIVNNNERNPNRVQADSLSYISIPCTVWFNADWIEKVDLIDNQLNETIDCLECINRSDTMSYLSNDRMDNEEILDYN